MKPISEPGQGPTNAYLGWNDNQLQRRPPVGAVANGPWHYVGDMGEPAFETGWGNIGGSIVPTRFRLNGLGETEIEFGCTGGDPDTIIFILPVGFRGAYTQEWACSDGAGLTANVRADSSGNVYWAAT